MIIKLFSPDGTAVVLSEEHGGSGDNLDILLSDEHVSPMSNVGSGVHNLSVPFFENKFRPDNVLSAFDGVSSSGNWVFQVCDQYGGDEGTVYRVLLAFTGSAAGGGVSPPQISKTFPGDILVAGVENDVTITLSNPNSSGFLSGVAFTDTYPVGLINAGSAVIRSNSCGGSLTANPGAGSLSFSGGILNAGSSCAITVGVVASSSLLGSTIKSCTSAVSTTSTTDVSDAACDSATISDTAARDYGDAPVSYGDAAHVIDSSLYLGSKVPDAESGSQYSHNAYGDGDAITDGTGTWYLSGDEDSAPSQPVSDYIPLFPVLKMTAMTYASEFKVNNAKPVAATLYGWIDFDHDGVFSADEGASVSVPAGSFNAPVVLNWSVPVDIGLGTTFIRLRLTTDSSVTTATPTGVASDGEVEDFALAVAMDIPPDSNAITITTGETPLACQSTVFSDDFDDLMLGDHIGPHRNGAIAPVRDWVVSGGGGDTYAQTYDGAAFGLGTSIYLGNGSIRRISPPLASEFAFNVNGQLITPLDAIELRDDVDDRSPGTTLASAAGASDWGPEPVAFSRSFPTEAGKKYRLYFKAVPEESEWNFRAGMMRLDLPGGSMHFKIPAGGEGPLDYAVDFTALSTNSTVSFVNYGHTSGALSGWCDPASEYDGDAWCTVGGAVRSGNELVLDNVTVTESSCSQDSISGFVYVDEDQNDSYSSAVDTALSAVTVSLFNNETGALISSVNTGFNGSYSFGNLSGAITYRVSVDDSDNNLPVGATPGTPVSIAALDVTGSSAVTNQNFGFDVFSAPARVCELDLSSAIVSGNNVIGGKLSGATVDYLWQPESSAAISNLSAGTSPVWQYSAYSPASNGPAYGYNQTLTFDNTSQFAAIYFRFSEAVTNPVLHFSGVNATVSYWWAGTAAYQTNATLVKDSGSADLSVSGMEVTDNNPATVGLATSAGMGASANGSVSLAPGDYSFINVEFYKRSLANNAENLSLRLTADCPPEDTDYSDAPVSGTAPNGSSTNNYGIASHVIDSNIYLGASAPDGELAALPSANADGDDNNGIDDESSVVIPALRQGASAVVSVDVTQAVSGDGYLQGWIDWNGDGDFADAGEQVATDLQLASGSTGTINVPVNVPATAITNSPTFARFRWSATQGLNSTAPASDGEVEDYTLTVADKQVNNGVCDGKSWGVYNNDIYEITGIGTTANTLTQNETANVWPFFSYALAKSTDNKLYSVKDNWLGSAEKAEVYRWDPVVGGTASATGLRLPAPGRTNTYWISGGTDPMGNLYFLLHDGSLLAKIDVNTNAVTTVWSNHPATTVTGPAGANFGDGNYYDLTFEANGSALLSDNDSLDLWRVSDLSSPVMEYVGRISGMPSISDPQWFLINGSYKLFGSDSNMGSGTYYIDHNTFVATKVGGWNYTDFASCDFGNLGAADYDYSDAPATYGAPSHVILAGIHLGATAPDGEAAAQPGAAANLDDTTGTDDEDAISSFPVLTAGATSYTIPAGNISATGSGTLHGWVDFDKNGVFTADEHAQVGVVDGVLSGSLSWSGINVGAAGNTFVRLRFTSATLTDVVATTAVDERATVPAFDGEVEDYSLTVGGGQPLTNGVCDGKRWGGNGNDIYEITGLGTTSNTLGQSGVDNVWPFSTYALAKSNDNKLYAAHYDWLAVDEQAEVYLWDPSTGGAASATGLLLPAPGKLWTYWSSAGSDPQGNLYFMLQDGSLLAKIDVNTNVVTTVWSTEPPTTVVGPSGKKFGDEEWYDYYDLVFEADGSALLVGNYTLALWRVSNLSSPEVEYVGRVSGLPSISVLQWFLVDGSYKLFGSDTETNSGTYYIDGSTLIATKVGDQSYSDLASCDFGNVTMTPVYDYSDAPATYGAPSHLVVSGIHLGDNAPDVDFEHWPDTVASIDDVTGIDDEDGIANFPVLAVGATSYTIPAGNISATGSGTLHGWVDFDNNGVFTADEHAQVGVVGGVLSGSLNWSGITTAASMWRTFVRLRFTSATLNDVVSTTGVDERATIPASDGEVEDYVLPVVQSEKPLTSGVCDGKGWGIEGNDLYEMTGLGTTASTLTQNAVNDVWPFSSVALAKGSNNKLYSVHRNSLSESEQAEVYRWDPAVGGVAIATGLLLPAPRRSYSYWISGGSDPLGNLYFLLSDGSLLAKIDVDTNLVTTVWNTDPPTTVAGPAGEIFGSEADYFNLTFSADGSALLSSSSNGIDLWRVNDLSSPEMEHVGIITGMPSISDPQWFLIDGSYKLFGSESNTNSGTYYIDSSTFVATKVGDGSYADFATCDFGNLGAADYSDAPATYGAPSHVILAGIHLGATAPDGEAAAQPGAAANLDDTTGTDDEDAISSFPVLTAGATSYTIPAGNISATGSGTLHGWVDFDKNGVFTADEHAQVGVVDGVLSGSLSWSGITTGSEGDTFVRLRFTSEALADAVSTTNVDERATAPAFDGEVEDYALSVGVAVPAGCALVVTTTADSNNAANNSGSLRDAIECANATPGANIITFSMPATEAGFTDADGTAGNGNEYWSIELSGQLPAITEAVTIDGRTQTVNQGDTNSGNVAEATTVGVDALALAAVAAPEVEVTGAWFGAGLDIRSGDVRVYGLGLRHFDSDVRLDQANTTGILLSGMTFGLDLGSRTTPVGGQRSNQHIASNASGVSFTVTNSLLSSAETKRAIVTGEYGNVSDVSALITGNHFIGGGLAGNLNNGAIEILRTQNPAITITNNRFVGRGAGTATDLAIEFNNYGSGINDVCVVCRVENNDISGFHDGVGYFGDTRLTGLDIRKNRVFDNTEFAVFLSYTQSATVAQNALYDNGKSGVLINNAAASGNVITRNSMYNNGQVGINLAGGNEVPAGGMTLNDANDTDTGANGLLNFPVLSGATLSATDLTISGCAPAGAVVELFESDVSPGGAATAGDNRFGLSADYGEGQTYLASLIEGSAADSDADTCAISGTDGNDHTGMNGFTFTLPVSAGLSVNSVFTATATLGTAGTSEFGTTIEASDPTPEIGGGSCSATGGTDILFIVDNSGSITTSEYADFSQTIQRAGTEFLADNAANRIAVAHFGGPYDSLATGGQHVYIERDLSGAAMSAPVRQFGHGGAYNSNWNGDHLAAAIENMRYALDGDAASTSDFIISPLKEISRNTSIPLQIVVMTDASRSLDAVPADISMLIDPPGSGAEPGDGSDFTAYNQLKAAGVSFSVVSFTTDLQSIAASAAIASVGGAYTGAIEANVSDPEGSQVAPRRYIAVTSGFNLTAGQVDELVESVAICGSRISGTVFEDLNYGGGNGRPFSTVGTDSVAGVTLEAYDSAGTYIAAVTSDGNGAYRLPSLPDGNYFIRAVNDTVRSNRTGSDGSELAIMTYRSDGVTAVLNEVGGRYPGEVDGGINNGTSILDTTNFTFTGGNLVGKVAQSVQPITLSGANVGSADFGFNFNTIVNANSAGQGSLAQFIANNNVLYGTGVPQVLPAAIAADYTIDDTVAVFMIPAASLVNGEAVMTPASELVINQPHVVIDGRVQAATTGSGDIVIKGSATTNFAGVYFGEDAGGSVLRDVTVSDFGGSGVSIYGTGAADADGVTVQSVTIRDNGQYGVVLENGAMGNQIISSTISGSGWAGIANDAAGNNTFSRNSISGNGALGIDLGLDGVTANSASDAWLNYPEIGDDSSVSSNGTTLVAYDFDLDVPANAAGYRVEFFSNTVVDSSGHGEGETYLGYVDIMPLGTGSENFKGSFTANQPVPAGANIAVTLTEKLSATTLGSTSEFSRINNGSLVCANLEVDGEIVVDENSIDVTYLESRDADGNPVTYVISGGADGGRFEIVDAASGDPSGCVTIRFIRDDDIIETRSLGSTLKAGEVLQPPPGDYEAPVDNGNDNVYDLEITMTDAAGNSVTKPLSVIIRDVNEKPYITSAAMVNFVERQATSTVVLDLASYDPDAGDAEGSGLSYSISGGDDGRLFKVDAQSGELRFVNSPDYGAPADKDGDNVYELTVRVTDDQGYADSQRLKVTVTDDPDQGGVQVAISALLQGPYEGNTGLMSDSLRSAGALPLNQPYAAAPFNYPGTETLSVATTNITGDAAVVDWVLVDLRSSVDPSQIVASQAALLRRNGRVTDLSLNSTGLSFDEVAAGQYYISLRHRNHLGVMTAMPVSLSMTSVMVDFSSAATPVDGEHARLSDGDIALLWSGDVTQDNRLILNGTGSDINAVLTAVLMAPGNEGFNSSYQLPGYHAADLNMDGKVVFMGPSNDANILLGNILSHPGNPNFSGNFIVVGGVR